MVDLRPRWRVRWMRGGVGGSVLCQGVYAVRMKVWDKLLAGCKVCVIDREKSVSWIIWLRPGKVTEAHARYYRHEDPARQFLLPTYRRWR